MTSDMLNQVWLNPLNKLKWREAIRNRRKTVTLRGGEKFSLKYVNGSVEFKPIPNTNGSTNPFVPCGTFDVETVLSDGWMD